MLMICDMRVDISKEDYLSGYHRSLLLGTNTEYVSMIEGMNIVVEGKNRDNIVLCRPDKDVLNNYNMSYLVYFPDFVTHIDSYAFVPGREKSDVLKTLVFGTELKVIYNNCFDRSNIGEVKFNSTGIKLDCNVFRNCANLSAINGECIRSVGSYGFSNVAKLKYLDLSNCVRLGENCLANTTLEELVLNKACKVYDSIFLSMYNLNKITLVGDCELSESLRHELQMFKEQRAYMSHKCDIVGMSL